LPAAIAPTNRRAPEEVFANARLIAAAPDMLEALHYAEEYFGGPHIRIAPGDPGFAFLQTIRAAIAKAEGRTNA
jgi:hypothetical protein